MTDPRRAARIAKIRHILALTSSDQPGEAQAAAEMAVKLKRRWGIEDAELEERDAPAPRPLESVWTAEELRDQLLDQTPIIAGRHISPDSIRRAGWASWRYPLGLRTWQSTADIGNRPIEGATVTWLEAQFTALECLVVPRLARMYPSWTDGQLSRAAAEALDGMFTAVDALSFPQMGDVEAFREYLATHPLPDRWLESTGGPVPGRPFGESRLHLDMETPRIAAIWGALLTEVRGVDDALIDVLLTEWEQGERAAGAAENPPRPQRGPRPPPAWGGPPDHPIGTDPSPGKSGMPRSRRRVRVAVFAVLAALVAIAVLYQLQDDTDAPKTPVDSGERVSDKAPPPPEPSGDGDTPPPDTVVAASPSPDPSGGGGTLDTAAAALPTLDAPDADEGSDGAGGLVQRVIGTVSPLVDLLIGAFTGDETIEIGVVCSNRSWASDDVPDLDTPEDCRRAAEGGVHAGTGWTWEFWGAGFESRIPDPESDPLREQWLIDPDAIVASLNDGPPIAFNDSAFDDALVALPPGQHTLRVNEWRGDGEWSGWTRPYIFMLVVDLKITAVCSWRPDRTVDECGEGEAAAIHTGTGWHWDAVVRGMSDWANVEFRFDGGPAFRGGSDEDYAAFDALAPGRHTIEARERRSWGWTDWSAPYQFETVAVLEVTAICSARWDRALSQWQHPASAADCRAVGAAGLRTGSGWDWQLYTRGGIEQASTVYRFDGGAEFRGGSDEDYAAFDALAPGRHTIEAREQRPWGWTDWSAPYEFETLAVLEVIAICSFRAAEAITYTACKAAERTGFDLSMDWWNIFADGVVGWENVVYRFDGGEATSVEDVEDLWLLGSGTHTVEIRERRSWGWTDWSPPYTFTVR